MNALVFYSQLKTAFYVNNLFKMYEKSDCIFRKISAEILGHHPLSSNIDLFIKQKFSAVLDQVPGLDTICNGKFLIN